MGKLPYGQIKEMVESGHSMSQIAQKLGKNVGSISNFCKRNGLSSKYISEPKHLPFDKIKNLYEKGESLYKLSKVYGTPPDTLKRGLKRRFPDIFIRGMDDAKRPDLLNDADALVSAMKVKSIRRIAKDLGIRANTVCAAVKRFNLHDLVRDQTVTDKPEDIKLLYESGLSLTQIANTYNTYPTTISNIISRVGGKMRKSGGVRRPSKYDELNDRDWLYEQYHTNDRSMAFIALYLGTTIGNISNALDKHNIPKKSKRDVYSKLRRLNAKKTTISTKWGTWKLQSQNEIDFVKSLPSCHMDVKYEPCVLSYHDSQYVPDFYVDGDYVEIKPPEQSVSPGVDRQKFIKQLLIARHNNVVLRTWYDGKFREYDDISDLDIYFALNWKLLFDGPNQCFEFLSTFGFRPIQWNRDMLLNGLKSLHRVPEDKLLNANYPSERVVNLIRHFNPHYWSSSHKGYMSVCDAFREGNLTVLKRSIQWLWKKTRGVNIYGLYKMIVKYNKDFSLVSIFKPWIARYVYQQLLPNGGTIVDPCMGWGGRFLGTVGYDYEYIGYDLNSNSVESNKSLAKFVGAASVHNPILMQADASGIDWPDGDLLFTSPPYDDTEYYDGLETQCRDTAGIYDNIMKFGGIVALNIPKRHRDKCIEIAQRHGRKVLNEFQMKTVNFMGVRESAYEPIIIFK